MEFQVFAVGFFIVGVWGLIVAIFADRFVASRFVRAVDIQGWWTAKASRTRFLGILLAVFGFTVGILGVTGVIGPG